MSRNSGQQPQPSNADRENLKPLESPNLRPISEIVFERIEIEGKGQSRKNIDDLTSLPVLLDASNRFRVVFRADNTVEIHTLDGKVADVQVDESALSASRFTLMSMSHKGNITTLKFKSNDSNTMFNVLVYEGEKEGAPMPPTRHEVSTDSPQTDYNYSPSRTTSPWREKKTVSESHGGRSGE